MLDNSTVAARSAAGSTVGEVFVNADLLYGNFHGKKCYAQIHQNLATQLKPPTDFYARKLFGFTYTKPCRATFREPFNPFNPVSYGRMAHPLRFAVLGQAMQPKGEDLMAKGFVLWLLGVPFGLIVLLWLFGVLR